MQAKFDGDAPGRPEPREGTDPIDENEPETLRENASSVAGTPLDRLSARLVPPRRSIPSLAPAPHLESVTTRTSTLPSASPAPTLDEPGAALPRRPSSTPPPPPPARPSQLRAAGMASATPRPVGSADDDVRIDVDALFSFTSPTIAPPPVATKAGAALRAAARARTERPSRRARRALRSTPPTPEPGLETAQTHLGRRATGWAVALTFGGALAALGYGIGVRGTDDERSGAVGAPLGLALSPPRAPESQATDAPSALVPAVDATTAAASLSADPAPVAGPPPALAPMPRPVPRETQASPDVPAPDASGDVAPPTPASDASSTAGPASASKAASATLDRAALGETLAAAASKAADCVHDPSGPSSVRVEAVFAPSGRTTRTSVVGGPYAGTETGACIARALREMHVPAFDGDAVVVTKTIRLR